MTATRVLLLCIYLCVFAYEWLSRSELAGSDSIKLAIGAALAPLYFATGDVVFGAAWVALSVAHVATDVWFEARS